MANKDAITRIGISPNNSEETVSNVHNLKHFQKGVSGNPAGRPAKIPAIDELLAKVLSEETDGMTAAEQILRSMVKQAIAGNLQAAEMLLNRAYGKPKQATEQPTDVTVRVVRQLSDDELLDRVNGIFDAARERQLE